MTVNEVQLTLACYQTRDSIDKRITGFNLYRAENDGTGRFVTFIDINDTNWVLSYTPDYATIDVSDTMIQGASYEAINEISETVTDLSMKYTLSTVVNFSMFVGICYTDLFDDASRMIFKSKPNKYMTFDASNEYVILDFVPKALHGYGGKLYAFGDNCYSRINPEGMYIEDTFTGKGIYSSKSITNTDIGLIWADRNGAYIMDQNGQVNDLSFPIIEENGIYTVSWKSIFSSYTALSVVYVPDKKAILFCDTYTGKTWTYYIPRGTWYYWVFPVTGQDQNTSLIVDSKGRVYYIAKTLTSYAWYELFAGSTYLEMYWQSRELVMTTGNEIKKYYKIVQDGNCEVLIGFNGNMPTVTPTGDKIDIAYRKANSISVLLHAPASATLISTKRIDIVYRNLGIRS
jgi:hypothetical protein